MIAEHLPFVRYLARKRFKDTGGRNGLDLEDLVSYGVIGLIQAIDRYNPQQGVAFHSYASSRIQGAMIDAIRAGDHLPRGARQRVTAIDRAVSELALELGHEPTPGDVRERTGMSRDEYREALAAKEWHITSLECVVPHHDPTIDAVAYEPADDLPEPTARLERESELNSIAEAIRTLPERERLVLALIYKEGLRRSEVAATLGVSETRVSQLYHRAISRVQAHPEVRAQAA